MRVFALLMAFGGAVRAFAPRAALPAARKALATRVAALDPLKEPLQAYSDFWVPLFQQDAGLAPVSLLKWGHPAAMAAVLLTMGGYGAFLGWAIRRGEGSAVYALSLGETARDLHPKVMGGALFFFVLGGQGGLILNQLQGRPILDSTHALTAVASLALMSLVAAAPLSFPALGANARAAHAYVGSATMALLLAHAAFGLQLGLAA